MRGSRFEVGGSLEVEAVRKPGRRVRRGPPTSRLVPRRQELSHRLSARGKRERSSGNLRLEDVWRRASAGSGRARILRTPCPRVTLGESEESSPGDKDDYGRDCGCSCRQHGPAERIIE